MGTVTGTAVLATIHQQRMNLFIECRNPKTVYLGLDELVALRALSRKEFYAYCTSPCNSPRDKMYVMSLEVIPVRLKSHIKVTD